MVFSGTTSAGETLRKAWSRVAGTALGVAAGVAATLAVHSNHAAAMALLFFFLFIAVYGLRLSYAVMTFGITAVLSLLYVLLGYFTDQLLVLRLVETAVGAACGGIAATFVFPIRTENVVNGVISEALNRLGRAVEQAVSRLAGDASANPLAAARDYDEAFQSVRAQLLPLIYTLRIHPDEKLRTRLLLLAGCAYSLRALASLAYEMPQDCPMEAIRGLQAQVRSQIDGALSAMNGDAARAQPLDQRYVKRDSAALEQLVRIARAVHRLAATFSVAQ